MKTKKYSAGCSKNASESVTPDQGRRKKTSSMIKPQTKTPRGRKALKDRKNTLKSGGKASGANVGTKLQVKCSPEDPGPAGSALGTPGFLKSEMAAKGILDKEKLKRLLSGVAQSKEVGKVAENPADQTQETQSAKDQAEKLTFQTMQKENIMKPIIDRDKLKKILNGLSLVKDLDANESEPSQAGLSQKSEAVVPVVNKDKLKTLLTKVYELQEGDSGAETTSEVIIDNDGSNLECIETETKWDKSARKNLKRRRELRPGDDSKSAKLEKQVSTVGFKEKLRRRSTVQKLDVTFRPKGSSPSASASNREQLKKILSKDTTLLQNDDILILDQRTPKLKDLSKAVVDTDKDKSSPSLKHNKAPPCNFDKQKLMRLLSGTHQNDDQMAKTSMSTSNSITSCPAPNPKKSTNVDTNSEGKIGDPVTLDAPFSLSNELLKSNVLTKSGDSSITLRGIMIDRLNAARFRYINEQLYMSTGEEAQKFFAKDPEAFAVYHQGYQTQVNKWPISPLNITIDDIARRKQPLIIADFGCGDAKLAKSVPNKVHSFDLVALNEHVTACNMAKVPLKSTSVDVAVFCLSLMGTNLSEYLMEANRILKMGGILKIAEVESRFESVPKFIEQLGLLGFSLMKQDTSHKMFVLLDFAKVKNSTRKKNPVNITLHPCLYKKR